MSAKILLVLFTFVMILRALETYYVHLLTTAQPLTINTKQVTDKFKYTGTASQLNIQFNHKRKVNIRKPKYCYVNFEDKRTNVHHDPNLTTIYFVTPTYPRPEQIPELTSLSHTLMHVPGIHWILADDNYKCSARVLDVLTRSRLPYTHISSPKPDDEGKPFPAGVKSRGVSNRKAALNWIYDHVREGILYFGDDDNTYDLQLFNEIRNTKKLSMIPVGLVGLYGVSTPVIDDNHTVVGFFDSWFNDRTFPVDMAGFAVNIKYLKRNATMRYEAGMLEDNFLTSAGFKIEDIETLADNCTKVLVWHTQSIKNKRIKLKVNIDAIKTLKYKSLATLLDELSDMNVIELNRRRGVNAFIIQNHTIRYIY